jgi:excinuclease UvrABC ATPase subunit
VIVVEHDRDTIPPADHVIDMGRRGKHGGCWWRRARPNRSWPTRRRSPAAFAGALEIAVPRRRRSGAAVADGEGRG